jgi:hypothetical protein
VAWAAGAALLALAAAGGFASERLLAGWTAETDSKTLEAAPRLLEHAVEEHKAELLAEVRLLSEDTRVRTTVMTAQFSESTVRDILDDLRKATGATVMAVLDLRGRIQASAGKEGLRSLDLGATPLLADALAKPVAQVWTLPDQVLVVGIAPVRAGRQVAALFLTGRELSAATLSSMEQATGVPGAVVVGHAVVAQSARAAPIAPVIEAAMALEEGRTHVVNAGGGEHLVRVSSTSASARAGRVIWALPRAERDGRVTKLRLLGWMPVALVGLSLALAVSLYRRRSDGEVA